MDLIVFEYLNSFNGKWPLFDKVVALAGTGVMKSISFMLVFWGLWFLGDNEEVREKNRNRLAATLILTIPIIGITRVLANYLPYSARPINTPGLDVQLYPGQPEAALDGWSSMPSDHASLFMGLAVAYFLINRKAGIIMIFWAIFVTSLPRVVVGLHWPSDVLVGWILGAAIVLALFKPTVALIQRINLVGFFQARETLGYPLLFMATYEVARLFHHTRKIVDSLI